MNTTSPASVRGLTVRQDQLDAIGKDMPNMETASAVSDLAIYGNGFFVVRDPETNASYATQAGHFSLDAQDYLVTESGERVQGCVDGSLTAVGDIQINAADLPPNSAAGSTIVCYSIDEQGKITVHLSDRTSFVRGQIMLQNFQDPQALVCEGNQLYSNMSDAGPLPALAAPGSEGLGIIQSGILEFSNAEAWISSN